jgi:hypothetical protein
VRGLFGKFELFSSTLEEAHQIERANQDRDYGYDREAGFSL